MIRRKKPFVFFDLMKIRSSLRLFSFGNDPDFVISIFSTFQVIDFSVYTY